MSEPTSLDAEMLEKEIAYVSAVGRVAYSWNRLQDALGQLFAQVTAMEHNTAFAVWYSIKSDRAQRDMLSAAMNAAKDGWTEIFPSFHADLKWVLDQANSLEDRRNDAVHAPCVWKFGPNTDVAITPNYFFGNPRATKLKGKNLLNEFTWYSECGETLHSFAHQISQAMYTDYSWPQRPLMPTLG